MHDMSVFFLMFVECGRDPLLLQQGAEPRPQQTDRVHYQTAELRSVKIKVALSAD